MNTLRAFQGVDTAFSVTLNPSSVDFPDAPALIAEVHKGDGRAALVTLTPIWGFTATDTITVPFPGTTLAPGNYILSTRLADDTAYLSWDALVIYPGTGSVSALRSLITPADCMGVIPDFKGDFGQLDGLTWLLEAATAAVENYCERKFILADYDSTWPYSYTDYEHYIDLEYPVASITSVSVGPAGWPVDPAGYTATTRYDLDARTGQLRVDRAGWPSTNFTSGHPRGRLIRVVYRAGYAIEQADIDLGVPTVPRDLQSACLMVAVAIRESARTAGPTLQQGRQGAYYTKSPTETAIPAPARGLLDQFARKWMVV